MEDLCSEAMQAFVEDLVETMRDHDGVGLAAPQVHVPLRVAVLESAENPRYPDAPTIPLTVVVNPRLAPADDELEESWRAWLDLQPHTTGLAVYEESLAGIEAE